MYGFICEVKEEIGFSILVFIFILIIAVFSLFHFSFLIRIFSQFTWFKKGGSISIIPSFLLN